MNQIWRLNFCALQTKMEEEGTTMDEDADEETTEHGRGRGGRGCVWCWFRSREEVVEEAKRQIWLAGPLIGVSLLQYSLQVIAIMFVARWPSWEESPLSGASLASSSSNVTGFGVLLGMGSALETQCGEAYGAKQYRMIGVHTQRAMLVHSLVFDLVQHQHHRHRPRPAPGHNIGRGQDIQPVDDPRPVCIQPPSVPQQVPADSEQGVPNSCEFWSH